MGRKKYFKMKKIFKISSLVAIVGLVAFNTYLAGDIFSKGENNLNSFFSLKSAHAETYDGGELPGGGITCSYGAPYDYCYVLTWKWCSGGMFFHYDCWANGNPDSSCNAFLATICAKITI